MTASFEWWRNALAGAVGPLHENQPQPGYYRKPARHGEPAEAIAIWAEGDTLHALRNGRDVDPCAIWTWCCREPITYETYVAVAERGEPWPEAVPGIGHNSGAPPTFTAWVFAAGRAGWRRCGDVRRDALPPTLPRTGAPPATGSPQSGASPARLRPTSAANFAELLRRAGEAGGGPAHARQAPGAGGRTRH